MLGENLPFILLLCIHSIYIIQRRKERVISSCIPHSSTTQEWMSQYPITERSNIQGGVRTPCEGSFDCFVIAIILSLFRRRVNLYRALTRVALILSLSMLPVARALKAFCEQARGAPRHNIAHSSLPSGNNASSSSLL